MAEDVKIVEQLTLDSLPNGVEVRVLAVLDKGQISRRLMEMGVIPGVKLRIIKSALFGCPIEIRVRGYNLAIRRNEAKAILVADNILSQSLAK